MRELRGKEIRHLRGLGHHLKPVVLIGKEGITPSITDSVEEALNAHELIKVKILESSLLDRHETADSLAVASEAAVVQVLGRTILLYRPSSENKIGIG